MKKRTITTTVFSSVACAPLLAVLLTGCSSSSDEMIPSAQTSSGACPVTVTDGWVKAADSGMTAAFGVLSSPSAQTITAASSEVAGRIELHEMAEGPSGMVMQPVDEGFAVPVGGELTLEPGGYHFMLMDLIGPVRAGDDVALELTCADLTTASVTLPARTFSGAEEEYSPHGSMSDSPSDSASEMPGTSMSEMPDSGPSEQS